MKLDEETSKRVYFQTLKEVQIQIKPSKKVFTTSSAKAGTLKFVPATTRIDVRPGSKDQASGVKMYEEPVDCCGEPHMVMLQPMASKEFVSPFCFMRLSLMQTR